MKKIIIDSAEEVVIRKSFTWTEENWKDLLGWLSQPSTLQDSYWKNVYEHIKGLTWNEVVEDFNDYYETRKEECICWQVPRGDGSSYTEYLGELIIEWMRDDLCDADDAVYDTECFEYTDSFEVFDEEARA